MSVASYNREVQPSIPRSKINLPPARKNLLPRAGVFQRLNAGKDSKLILVSAPAGYGKTTLLSEWARGNKAKTAWVTLDENDNEIGYFIFHLFAGLRMAFPKLGDALSDLQLSTQFPAQAALSGLLGEIEDLLQKDSGRRLVLILDDYHVVGNPEVHAAMEYLLKNLSERSQVVVSSRVVPEFSVSRLRASRLLTELYVQDVKFTPEEVNAFLNQIMDLNLPPNLVTSLNARLEGWAVGLQLAALSIQERGGNERDFFEALSGSHRHILDYLTDEALMGLPESLRDFLFQTSILSDLTGDLCEAVCDFRLETSGQEILERLDRMNVFILPMDDERRWYRYHHIFSDVLSARLKLVSPALLPKLHQRASAWYEKHGRIHDAIKHALDAGDFSRAASLVENTDPADMVLRGRAVIILNWLDALPEDVVRVRPRLSLSYAWALFIQGKWDEIEPRLQAALHALEKMEPAATEGFLGEVAALRAWVALEHDNKPQAAIQLAQEALKKLSQQNTLMTSALYSLLGDAYVKTDQIESASESYHQAIQVGRLGGHDVATLMYLTDLARLQIAQGKLREAEKNYAHVLERTGGRLGSSIFPVARALIGLGIIHYQRNDLRQALLYLQAGVDQCEVSGYLHVTMFGYIALARVRQALAEHQEAHSLLNRAEDLARKQGKTRAALQAVAFKARFAEKATPRSFADAVGIEMDDVPDPLREVEYLTLAWLAIRRGEKTYSVAAFNLLNQLQGRAEAAGRMESLIEILALQSIALEKSKPQQAGTILQRALRLAETEGHRSAFLELGTPMANLLRRLDADGNGSEFSASLIRDFEASQTKPAQNIIEPLSRRELDVLKALAAGLSNQEIADKLSVSLSTVNTHTNYIYQKLGVHNRTQAIIQAKSLGLL